MTTLWRCCKRSRIREAFTGAGGRYYGGRWHTEGRPVVYTSDEASLSLLEVLVHGWTLEGALATYALVPCELPEEHIHNITDHDLPEEWDAPQPTAASQAWGDLWIKEGQHVAVRVPSAVVPGTNVLINPLHPLAADLVASKRHVEWNPRLRTAAHVRSSG